MQGDDVYDRQCHVPRIVVLENLELTDRRAGALAGPNFESEAKKKHDDIRSMNVKK